MPSAAWRGGLGDPRADAAGLSAGSSSPSGGLRPWIVSSRGRCARLRHRRAVRPLEGELAASSTVPSGSSNDSELMAPAAARRTPWVSSSARGRSQRTRRHGRARRRGRLGMAARRRGQRAGARARGRAGGARPPRRRRGSDPLAARLCEAYGVRDGVELAVAVTDAASAEGWGTHASLVFVPRGRGIRARGCRHPQRGRASRAARRPDRAPRRPCPHRRGGRLRDRTATPASGVRAVGPRPGAARPLPPHPRPAARRRRRRPRPCARARPPLLHRTDRTART